MENLASAGGQEDPGCPCLISTSVRRPWCTPKRSRRNCEKAIAEKRAPVGINRDQVLAAMGHPDHKYRETKGNGIESEDWIFGAPPGKVTFVTFNGSKVVKVKDGMPGLGGQTTVK